MASLCEVLANLTLRFYKHLKESKPETFHNIALDHRKKTTGRPPLSAGPARVSENYQREDPLD